MTAYSFLIYDGVLSKLNHEWSEPIDLVGFNTENPEIGWILSYNRTLVKCIKCEIYIQFHKKNSALVCLKNKKPLNFEQRKEFKLLSCELIQIKNLLE